MGLAEIFELRTKARLLSGWERENEQAPLSSLQLAVLAGFSETFPIKLEEDGQKKALEHLSELNESRQQLEEIEDLHCKECGGHWEIQEETSDEVTAELQLAQEISKLEETEQVYEKQPQQKLEEKTSDILDNIF